MPADRTIVSQDFQALSLFRIVFALYLVGEFFAGVYPFFLDFYGERGVLPLSAMADADAAGFFAVRPLIWALNLVQSRALFAALYVAALLAFALGYRTRLATAAVFVLNAYLFWRNPYIATGAETLAHLLLLWSLFVPLGRYWSVDAALDQAPRDRPYPRLPFLALRVQIASLYLFAGLFKMAGEPWRQGSALIWALGDDVFGATAPALLVLTHAPWLAVAGNYLVIAFQLAFPLLIYCPWRNDLVRGLALAGSVAMHASFIFFLNVGGFPFVCMAMLILLVPDAWIDRLLRRRRQRLAAVAVYYEPGCGFCRRVSLVLREFLLSPTASVQPSSDDATAHRLLTAHTSWVVRGADGRHYLKWQAMDYLLRQNWPLAPLAWLGETRLLRRPLELLYDAIGANRRTLGPLANILLPYRSPGAPNAAVLALCGVLMGVALLSNVLGLVRLSFPIARGFDQLSAALQVRQSWEIFAPGPVHFRRSYRLAVTTADGATHDLMAFLPVPWISSQPGRGHAFATHRWAKYFTSLDELDEPKWAALGRYLCEQARMHLPQGSAARSVEVVATAEPIGGTPPHPHPEVRRTFECALPS